MMGLYAQSGEPANIIDQYQMLVRALKAKLGVQPFAQTEALYRESIAPLANRHGN